MSEHLVCMWLYVVFVDPVRGTRVLSHVACCESVPSYVNKHRVCVLIYVVCVMRGTRVFARVVRCEFLPWYVSGRVSVGTYA